MIAEAGSLVQAALGTLFTWFLTAAGAAVVVIFSGSQMKLLHASLGFAAGVMLAASFWSLLSPAIEMAEQSKHYGSNGEYAFLPVSVGFLFGGLFVYLTDLLISSFGLCAPQLLLAMQKDAKDQLKKNHLQQKQDFPAQANLTAEDALGVNSFKKAVDFETPKVDLSVMSSDESISIYTLFSSSEPTNLEHQQTNNVGPCFSTSTSLKNPRSRFMLKNYIKGNGDQKRRSTVSDSSVANESQKSNSDKSSDLEQPPSDTFEVLTKDGRSLDQWKRIVLLIVAITVHNIPEGLAVGVGFGAIGSAPSATFESARNLAIGIGIQNFPEGLAVSLPLKAVGFSLWKSFWYGQLSGMVEPIFGILGAVAVSLAKPLLPYALSFAAGAMIYVVVDDIIPEANSEGREKLATSATIIGFVLMMALDVGLGG